MSAPFSILSNRQYAKYFSALLLSRIGDGMQFIAMSWLLYRLTNSIAASGWLLVLTSLPGMLFSPWIGVLVDRHDARRICIGVDLVCTVVLMIVTSCAYHDTLAPWLIYCAEFLLATCAAIYQPAAAVMLQRMLGQENLLAANSMSSIGTQTGMLIGTVAAGFLIAQLGGAAAFFCNALSFLLSALFTFWISLKHFAPKEANANPASAWQEFKEGMRYLLAHRNLLGLALLQVIIFVPLFICNTLLPGFVNRQIHAGASGFGLIEGAFALGAIICGLLLKTILQRFGLPRARLMGLFGIAIAMWVFGSATQLPQAMLGYFLFGFLIPGLRISTDTALQTSVDQHYLGRILSTIYMLISWLGLIAYASIGYLGDAVALAAIYYVLAGVMLVSTVLTLVWQGRR